MIKMFKKITLFVAALAVLGTVTLSPTVGALNITKQGSSSDSNKKLQNDNSSEDFTTIMKRVISTLLFVLGIIAVIIIIIGGIRFATANGDPGAVKTARNMILYACIGLIVAIMSYAIVNFVLDAFKSP
jgi:hypothetical protein